MRPTVQTLDRLAVKSDAHSLSHTLTTRYSLSIAEAECLTAELHRKQLAEDPSVLLDGQCFYTAIDRDEPAGKPLAKCRTLRIRLTLHCCDDLVYRGQHGLAALQRLLVSRVCHEAYQQGALLSQEDLVRLLYLSRATVQRILAEYRQAGDYIPTRGSYHDIGPAPSPKAQDIRLYLRGFQPTEIAQRLCHHLSSVERYLDDFCRVMGALEAGFEPSAIEHFSRHSQRLIAEYRELYQQFKDQPDYQNVFQAIRRRMQGLWAGKKGGP
jgi:biotin operon repressor